MKINKVLEMIFKTEHHTYKQFICAAILSLIQMTNGFGVAWSASMVQKLLDTDETPLNHVATDYEVAWITNILFFGCLGAFVSSFFANRFGRRPSFIFGGCVYCLSYLLLTFATSTGMILAGRLFVACNMGYMQILTYLYIGEIASPYVRGRIMTMLSIFQTTGCLLSFCLGPYLSYFQFGCVPIALTIIFIISSLYLNESPVYYVIKGDEEAARNALIYFGRNKDIDKELKLMFDNAKALALEKRKWIELFIKTNRKAFFVTIPLYIIEQASGIIAVILNATAIFKAAGSSVDPAVATMIVGATNLLGSLISPFIVDRYGRRVLLFFSTGGCSIAMAILGTYFYLLQISPESLVSLGWLPLAALVVALFVYSFGLSTIPHVLAGEMFSPNFRGLGSSIGFVASNISGLTTTSIYNYLASGHAIHTAFWMFAGFDLAGAVLTVFVVPETKGKTLTEINHMLGNQC